MSLLRECGSTRLLRKCGTATLLRACPPASGTPCDYDTILATVTGMAITDCCAVEPYGDGHFYGLRNLSLHAMPVSLTKVNNFPNCWFYGEIGYVELWEWDLVDGCTSYSTLLPVYVGVGAGPGEPILIYTAPSGHDPWGAPALLLWADSSWESQCAPAVVPCFGTFTGGYDINCTTGGIAITLEAP